MSHSHDVKQNNGRLPFFSRNFRNSHRRPSCLLDLLQEVGVNFLRVANSQPNVAGRIPLFERNCQKAIAVLVGGTCERTVKPPTENH